MDFQYERLIVAIQINVKFSDSLFDIHVGENGFGQSNPHILLQDICI